MATPLSTALLLLPSIAFGFLLMAAVYAIGHRHGLEQRARVDQDTIDAAVAAGVKKATGPLQELLRRAENEAITLREEKHRHDLAHPVVCNDPYLRRVSPDPRSLNAESTPRAS